MFSSTAENKINLIHAMLDAAKVAALGIVLTFAAITVPTQEAEAACILATATADSQGVNCGDATDGGFSSDGFDDQTIIVFDDSKAGPVSGVAIDLTSGGGEADGTDDSFVIILNNELDGSLGAEAGLVVSVDDDAIVIEGDDNTIANGGSVGSGTIGGGSIIGADDGIEIDGAGNEVYNVNNGNSDTVVPGLISGGGGAGEDGIEVSGGTYPDPNIINNGLMGSGSAYIISGGAVDAATGDAGIAASGVITINNGDGTNGSSIQGGDEGIEYQFADILTVNNAENASIVGGLDGISLVDGGSRANIDNDGSITGTLGDGIRMGDGLFLPDDDVTVNLSGSGSVTGGDDGISIADSDSTLTVDDDGATGTQTITGQTGDGINVVSGTGQTITINDGSVTGDDKGIDADGISSVTITVGDGDANLASVTGVNGDGIIVGSSATILVDSDGSVSGGEYGIDADSNVDIDILDGSVSGDFDGINTDGSGNILVTGTNASVTGGSGTGSTADDADGIDMDSGNTLLVSAGATVSGDDDGIDANDSNGITVTGAGTTVTGGDANGGGDGIDVDGGFGAGNSVTVIAGAVVTGYDNGIELEENNTILVSGTGTQVIGLAGEGIGEDSNGDDNDIDVVDGAVVTGATIGINVDSDNDILVDGTGTTVTGTAADGIEGDDGNTIAVTGGASVSGGDDGIDAENANDVTVSGGSTVTGGDDGIDLLNTNTVLVTGTDTSVTGTAGDGIEMGSGNDLTVSAAATVLGDDDGIFVADANTILVTGTGTSVTGTNGDGIDGDDFNDIRVRDNAVVNGDPGIIVDDNNLVLVDTGGTVTAANNGIDVDDSNTIIIGDTPLLDTPGVFGGDPDVEGDGTGTVNVTGTGNGISLTDGQDGESSSVNENNVYVGAGGLVRTASSGDGIVVGNPGYDNSDNEITIAGAINAGDVDNDGVDDSGADWDAEADGVVLNVQASFAEDNTVTVLDGGVIQAGGTGIAILGDDDYDPFSSDDSLGNNVDIQSGGIVRAGLGQDSDDHGILVENPESDINVDGLIDTSSNADADGIHFSVIHSDTMDGDSFCSFPAPCVEPGLAPGGELLGGSIEPSYTGAGEILAGRDGIHYDDVTATGDTVLVFPVVPILGPVDFGPFQELVVNELDIQAGRDGIHFNDGFIVANGLNSESEISAADDALHGGSNNFIFNFGSLEVGGLDPADGGYTTNSDSGVDAHGVELSGGNNYVLNFGEIDSLDATAGDGIHIAGDTSTVINYDGIYAGDDGIHVGDGTAIGYLGNDDDPLFFDAESIMALLPPLPNPDGDNTVINEALIVAGDSGIVAGDFSIIINNGSIDADFDGSEADDADVNGFNAADGATAGIVVEDFNTVENNGGIEGGPNADGIYAEDDNGGGWGSITNNGLIDVGQSGISVDSDNDVTNNGDITGDVNGILLRGDDNDVESTSGSTIVGGTGGAINIQGDDNNVDIEHDLGSIATSGGAGILIGSSADDNLVEVDGTVTGDGHGLDLQGDDNDIQITGDLIGITGDGANISGDDNQVEVDGSIIGDPGVVISGDDNDVETTEIIGTEGGVAIYGDDNKVETTGLPWVNNGSIQTTNGWGVEITGDDNEIDAQGEIASVTGGGVRIAGSDNKVEAGDTSLGVVTAYGIGGGTHGVLIDNDGANNEVTTSGAILGGDGDGVSVNGDNNIIKSGVTETAAGPTEDLGIYGANNGVSISGDDNNVETDGFILGGGAAGVTITGDDNSVSSEFGSVDGNAFIGIVGGTIGVGIDGNSNVVSTPGVIYADNGDGVNIAGNSNNVEAGFIFGAGTDSDEAGVVVTGNLNSVTASGSVGGDNAGVAIIGSLNTFTGGEFEGDGISALGATAVFIEGNLNDVSTDGDIVSTAASGDGVEIVGDNNTVTANGNISGGEEGVTITGGDNTVSATGSISSVSVAGNDNDISSASVTGGATINGDENILDTGDIGGALGVTGDGNDVDAGGIGATTISGDDNDVDATGALASLEVTGDDNNVSSSSVTGAATIGGDENTLDTGAIGGALGVTGDGNDVDAASAGATTISGDDNDVDATGALASLGITGDDNTIASAGVTGGAFIEGDENTFDTGDIGGGLVIRGDGNDVDGGNAGAAGVTGDDNDVDLTGSINGGLAIKGDGNDVAGGGSAGATTVIGNDNVVSTAGDINGFLSVTGNDNDVESTEVGGAASVSGNQNILDTGDISGALTLTGNTNDVDAGTIGGDATVTGNDNNLDSGNITGELTIAGNDNDANVGMVGDGIDVDGNDNDVVSGNISTSTAGQDGVNVNGVNNSVDVTGLSITADGDGIYNNDPSNQILHDAGTNITAGDDGIELGYAGDPNGANRVLDWAGTINADDHGFTANGTEDDDNTTLGNWTVNNTGTINGNDDVTGTGSGIRLADNNVINNAENANISGYYGIEVGDNNVIDNDGTIHGDRDGINMGNNNVVTNSSPTSIVGAANNGITGIDGNDIHNEASGYIGAGDDGINVDSDNTIVNDGWIEAGEDGIAAGQDNSIVNNGDIDADSDGIRVGSGNLVYNADGATIDAGEDGIQGNDNNGVFAFHEFDSDGNDLNEWILEEGGLINDGEINAGNDGIFASDDNWIENTGSIDAGSVGIQVDGDNNYILSDGTISAVDEGIYVSDGGDNNVIYAYGTIGGDFDDDLAEGIELEGSVGNRASNNEVWNYATIDVTGDGILLEDADSNTVVADGTINAGNAGISLRAADSNTVYVNGSINSLNDGVQLVSGSESNTVEVNGSIDADNHGVHLNASDSTVIQMRDASIDAGVDGIKVDNGSDAGQGSISIDSDSSIVAGDDGIKVKDNSDDWEIYNDGTIYGGEDGVDIGLSSDNNALWNTGDIEGDDHGVRIFRFSDDNVIVNSGDITGGIDGVHIERSSENTVVENEGFIGGGMHGVYTDSNDTLIGNGAGGIITATNSTAGVNIQSDGNLVFNTGGIGAVSGYSPEYGLWVTGDDNVMVNVDTSDDSDGARGQIMGTEAGIAVVGSFNLIVNGTDGVDFAEAELGSWQGGDIVGGNAGIYVGYDNFDETAISNGAGGLIEVTGGLCTPPQFSADCAETPVAAIDSGDGELGIIRIGNAGTITGEDVFSDGFIQVDTMTQNPDGTEAFDTDGVTPLGPDGTPDFTVTPGASEGDSDVVTEILVPAPVQQASRLAIRDGDGMAIIENFDGGVINGNIETNGGNDILAMETGSTLNGNADLGQTTDTDHVLVAIEDDSGTPDVDESMGGLLFDIDHEDTDVSVDELVLFGEGEGRFDGNVTEAELLEKFDSGTWDINGSVTIDGITDFDTIDLDLDGDGDIDSDVHVIDETFASDIWSGRLNVGGTTEDGVASGALLTTPVLNVHPGDDYDGNVGVLGGHGTVATDPGMPGGGGGVHVMGYALGQGDLADSAVVGQDPDLNDLYTWETDSDLSVDWDDATDMPHRGMIAPGDETTRIGTLTVSGNVAFDGFETANLTQVTETVVMTPDDPDTEEDESAGGTAYTIVEVRETGREVVTNWGGQFEADLKDSGEHDRLNVVASGSNMAIISTPNDTTGPGDVPIDNETQDPVTGEELFDSDGVTPLGPDGVQDFEIVDDVQVPLFDLNVPGAGGPDGVFDSVTNKATEVPDGQVTLGGRLDVILDGEFVDLTTNGAPDTILDPDNTGCNDAPDGTPNCFIPNPAVGTPDGELDVDANGDYIGTADFSVKGEIFDIIVAEGGVVGEFDEYGFDGGPNDGALVNDAEGGRIQVFKGFLQYLPDRVRIISIPDFGPMGGNANQTAFGNYVDGLTQYGLNRDGLHESLAYLGIHQMEFGNGSYLNVVNRLTPEFYNPYNEVAIALAGGSVGQVQNRALQARSGNRTSLMVQGYSVNTNAGDGHGEKKASFWIGGTWNDTEVDSDNGFIEYGFDSLVGYLGFDYAVADGWLLGIMGSFGETDVDYDYSSASEGEVESWSIGGYISYFGDNGLYANAGGGYGDLDIETTRDVSFSSMAGDVLGTASAEFEGDYVYFFGELGYSFDINDEGLMLAPELGLIYTNVDLEAFSETGPTVFNLAVDEQGNKSVRGTAQLRLSKAFESGDNGTILPYVRVGVAHEFEDDLRVITSRFVGDNGSFVTLGEVPRGTTAIFGAGVAAMLNNVWSIQLDYAGEIGGNYKSHSVSGSVRLRF